MNVFEPISPEEAAKLPQPEREHVERVFALGKKVVDLINAEEVNSSVALDAILGVYTNAAQSYGREAECADYMVQIGGAILMRRALQQQAAGLDPFTPPEVH